MKLNPVEQQGIYDAYLIFQFVQTLEDTILGLLFVIKYVQFIPVTATLLWLRIQQALRSNFIICNMLYLS